MKDITIKAGLAIIIFCSILAYLFFTLNRSVEPELIISQDQFEIKAPHGITQKIVDIKQLSLRNSIPEIVRKINGLDTANSLCGLFRLSELGDGYLFLGLRTKGPFLLVELSQGYILINSKDQDKTQEMLRRLSAVMIKTQ